MFKALYRKYRPKTFSDVVGQNHIIPILQNAIKKNKISHAYLFYGPRGTGKTSIAKIFANEVNNNENYLSDSVDIVEIDAASNNGVDEIREIKENIKYLPNKGKYKIYIIDEVHMLTTSAFNALLKTLEEPPSHIIFILATTEMYKLPATVLSRCQKFEFKDIKNEELFLRLKNIAEKENIVIEENALKKIASISKGGLRDAIGILEQVSNYNTENITLNDVLTITSCVSEDVIIEFYKNILNKNTSESLLMYNQLVADGKDTKILITELINLSKDILIYKNLKDNNSNLKTQLEKISQEIEKTSSSRLYDIIENLAEAENKIRFSTEYISYMQICIINITTDKKDDNEKIQKLEEKITKLEKRIEEILNNNKIVKEEKIKDSIIPNKYNILKVIDNSNDKLLNYSKVIFTKILKIYENNNEELFNILKLGNLLYSSKEGCLLVLDGDASVFKTITNKNYNSNLESYFSKLLDIDYKVYILQKEQYNYLIENKIDEKKNILEENKQQEDIKKSKIEEIFSDIIVEK